jgi:hypothetical protein
LFEQQDEAYQERVLPEAIVEILFHGTKGEKFPRGFSVFYQGSAVLDRLPGFVQGCGQNTDVVRVEDAPLRVFFQVVKHEIPSALAPGILKYYH